MYLIFYQQQIISPFSVRCFSDEKRTAVRARASQHLYFKQDNDF